MLCLMHIRFKAYRSLVLRKRKGTGMCIRQMEQRENVPHSSPSARSSLAWHCTVAVSKYVYTQLRQCHICGHNTSLLKHCGALQGAGWHSATLGPRTTPTRLSVWVITRPPGNGASTGRSWASSSALNGSRTSSCGGSPCTMRASSAFSFSCAQTKIICRCCTELVALSSGQN